MRVGIYAAIKPGESGGIEQFLIGLIHGLARLRPSDVEFTVFVVQGQDGWLSPYLSDEMKCISIPRYRYELLPRLYRFYGRKVSRRLWTFSEGLLSMLGVGRDWTLEKILSPHIARLDVIHFAIQAFARLGKPSVFNPHDLQYLHLPEFWTRQCWLVTDSLFRTACRECGAIAVSSHFVKEDLVSSYGIPAQKVRVIPPAPVTEAYAVTGEREKANVARKYSLPEEFAFFPAQTWRHKNHIRLLEAVSKVSRQGLRMKLVCCGKRNDFYPTIEAKVRSLGLENQVRFLGFIALEEMKCLYQLAKYVVFPSLFESGALPIFEAMLEGCPVACSNVTAFPELAKGAALLFNPYDVGEIAQALQRMESDRGERGRLSEMGKRRVAELSWQKTAQAYLDLYRKVHQGESN